MTSPEPSIVTVEAGQPDVFSAQIDAALARSAPLWKALDGKPIFMTGGTGFFGRWLLSTMGRAQETMGLDLSITLLTRSADVYRARAPRLAALPCVHLVEGDVKDFAFPKGDFAYLIDGAATPARTTFAGTDNQDRFETTLAGTRRFLEFAAACRPERMLMIGSGSIYGNWSDAIGLVGEDYTGAPSTLNLDQAVSHAKRSAEFLAAYHSEHYGVPLNIARCFSFVGAYLPLNLHYAIGNFLRDALAGRDIVIRGDGRAIRSYLFAGDLVTWLLTLLLRGEGARAYNVGSDEMVSIGDLAHRVRDIVAPQVEVTVMGEDKGGLRSFYGPSIDRARSDLGLDVWTPLDEAIRLTAEAARQTAWNDAS